MSKPTKQLDLISTTEAAKILGVTDSRSSLGPGGKLRVVEFGPQAKLLDRSEVVRLSKVDRKPGAGSLDQETKRRKSAARS